MDLKQIQELIRFVSKAGVSEVSLEQGDFKITIKTQSEEEKALRSHMPFQQVYQVPQQMQAQPSMPAPAASSEARSAEGQAQQDAASAESKMLTIKSPMIGTFYRKPSPDKEPFIKVGDTVTKGQVVCVIEAMKLFNEIEAEISGKVVKILADDTSPVEYDQPLFLIEP